MRVVACATLCWGVCLGSGRVHDLLVPLDFGLGYGSLTVPVNVHGRFRPAIEAVVELKFDVDPEQFQTDEDMTDCVVLQFSGSISGNSSDSGRISVRYPRDTFAATRRFTRPAVIDLTPGSIFTTAITEMLFIPPPQGEGRGSLVMRPENYLEYCFEGGMALSVFSDSLELMVEVRWLINGSEPHSSESFPPVPFKFNSGRVTDSIPDFAMNAFMETFLPQALGTGTFGTVPGFSGPGNTLIHFDCISDQSILDRLPVLEYRIMRSGDELEPATLIKYLPRDYVRIADGRCETRFESSGGSRGLFGLLTFSSTVIYFDNVGHFVGFGEPI